MSYCSATDLYAFGIPRGSTPNPGRGLDSAVSSTCALDGHGFVTGDAVLLSPAGDGGLPPELSANTTYYVQAETEHTFKLRATPGGSALSFTDAEDPIIVVSPLPVSEAIAWAERIIDDSLPAHLAPITGTVPEIVRMTCAELAAGKLLALSGAASVSLTATVDAALARLARWAKGVPVRGSDVPPRTNISVVASTPFADRRGWNRFGGI